MKRSVWATSEAEHGNGRDSGTPVSNPSFTNRFSVYIGFNAAPLHSSTYSNTSSGGMAVCKFYQRGECRFGVRCRDEHPGANDPNRHPSGAFKNASSNRFGALNNTGDSYRPGQQTGNAFGGRNQGQPRYHLNKDDVKADLTDQRPIYPFSCYGPGRDAPRQLIEGPVEISPEELRLRFYQQRSSVGENVAKDEETALLQQSQQQVERILKDLDGAMKYVEDGANVHPNRHDIAEGKIQPSSAPSPFQKPPTTSSGSAAFGQPSAFGQRSSPFAQAGQTTPAFGQASNPGQSSTAFGQTSGLGGTGAFGKPSMPGAGAFGQPSALGGASGFGQTSALGAGTGFGKPSMPGAGSGFGQASALGGPPAFGQASAPSAGTAFGKPSAPGFGQTNALGQNTAFGKPSFGTTAFGQPAQPGATASPFATAGSNTGASPFGQQVNKPSPFGQAKAPGTNAPAFGQPAQLNNASPFGQQAQSNTASPFGGQAQANTASPFNQGSNPNPFGQQPAAQPQSNPFATKPPQSAASGPGLFGTPSVASPPAASGPGLFGKPSPSAFGPGPTQQQPSANSNPNPFATKAPGQPAAAAPSPFGIQPAAPAAAPASAVNGSSRPIEAKERIKEGKAEDYEGEQGKLLEEIYRRVAQLGKFNDDEDMPLIPPKVEWIAPFNIPPEVKPQET